MALYGYARVGTDDQEIDFQIDALKQAGCVDANIYSEKASGARSERPRLDACLSQLQEGDTLVVWRLDRLGRSMPHLVKLIEELRERGVGFRSICDVVIDTTNVNGDLICKFFSSLAQFDRGLTQERTRTGLNVARARGKKGGRKPISVDDPRIKMAKTLYEDKGLAINSICEQMQVSRSTFYRLVNLKDPSYHSSKNEALSES